MSGKTQETVIFTDTDTGGIIHIANIKGGVGKSTVATNLAAALSKKGPTLVIDLDVQGSATSALGVEPSECSISSWELFRRRFSPGVEPEEEDESFYSNFSNRISKFESEVCAQIVGNGDISSCSVNVGTCLDLIPANAALFNSVHSFHLQNFLFNLDVCRNYYKYIIVDTPSIWNNLTKALYKNSDLNLIPVTLNALSTRSLREYLFNVKNMVEHNPYVRIRIVKNEVFGKSGSKIKGKTRTMNENRQFLDSLCEQVVIKNDNGVALLPQSILFDLEIPESAVIRDAQDRGRSVIHYHQYSSVAKAFDELGRRVQYVLNSAPEQPRESIWQKYWENITLFSCAAAAIILMAIFSTNSPITNHIPRRPIAPQQLIESPERVFTHRFEHGESIYKLAKFAITYFRAVVPSMHDVYLYAKEIIDIHNRTRIAGEQTVGNIESVPEGTKIKVYPPSHITNPNQEYLIPVYRYFTKLVEDKFAYITGDWCERGTGGGRPHYGIDVAAPLGAYVYSPVDGVAAIRNSSSAGRTLGVVKDKMVIFFSHLNKRFFKEGEKVNKGDPIGTIGMTGVTSGPHVHIGYGIQTVSRSGVYFGRHRYEVTDPKLFFYREVFLNSMKEKSK
jgi:cellulose biosynthesis protein BcsQ